MAFRVTTYESEEQLAEDLLAIVTRFSSEQELQIGLEAAINPWGVVANGAYFTLIDDPLAAGIDLQVLAKGNYYTMIKETLD